MPNRIIKESICVNERINALNWFEEVLFYRLIVKCDDYGRFEGRELLLRNLLFPAKQKLSVRQVEEGLKTLVRVGLVEMYEAEGQIYLFLTGWKEHQQIRAKRSRFPAPDSSCLQMIADDCKCPRNPNPNPNPNPNSNPNPPRAEEFERFWAVYPKKVGRKKAQEAFGKISEPVEVLLRAVEEQKQSGQWRKENGRFVPHPATWLSGERWKDEVKAEPEPGKRELDADEQEAIRRMLES